eukprot:747862-Hanusia_phi.AAC.12
MTLHETRRYRGSDNTPWVGWGGVRCSEMCYRGGNSRENWKHAGYYRGGGGGHKGSVRIYKSKPGDEGQDEQTTAPWADPSHRITTRRSFSIFRALSVCCPASVRNEDPYVGRHGMTEIEFNKHLEKNGFIKMRTRSPYTEDWENTEDCRSVQGIRYFYTNRRWRNPDDQHDREVLEQGWRDWLAPSTALKLDLFLQVCREFHNEWETLTSRKRLGSFSPSSECPSKKRRTLSPTSDVCSSCEESRGELEEEALYYMNAKQEFELASKDEFDSFVLSAGGTDEMGMVLPEVDSVGVENLKMVEPAVHDSTAQLETKKRGCTGQGQPETSLLEFINNHEEMVGKLDETDILRIISDLDADF